MNGTKGLLASKTFWGSIIAGGAGLLGAFGVSIGEEERAALTTGITAIGTLVGVVLAIYGRVKADTKIG